MNIDNVVRAYLTCALWSSVDGNDNPMGDVLEIDDIAAKSVAAAEVDCLDFVGSCGALLEGLTDEQIGHDFWMTRNHHGAGFWDRGLGEQGVKLTEIAHAYGSVDCYVDSNGEVSLS
jgi:hypothetical protein